MEPESVSVIRAKSQISYSYATIKITQSRIAKGLIAIPVSLAERFPKHNETIQVYLNDSPTSQTKSYSSYTSSTRECRIGGLRHWFEQNDIKSGDELVVQFIDGGNFVYRLVPERNFILHTRELQNKFDGSENEKEANREIANLSDWMHLSHIEVATSEYHRLAETSLSEERRYINKSKSIVKEVVPASLRVLLRDVYKGHCQICDFWFLRKDREPYFEVHHLDPSKGHHPKNILSVCGNCHNQFEYSDAKQYFSEDNWLIRVSFNENLHHVRQALLAEQAGTFIKELYI